jgi:RNA ligase (TIGR02306 family)
MSEFHVEVVEIGAIEPHPNADALDITHVRGEYPVCIRKGEFKPGDRAVYLPIDSIVRTDGMFAFLGPAPTARIKAKRLRGVFSMGLLVKADPSWPVGMNVQAELGVEKHDPEQHITVGGEDERDPGFLPVYTDIEGFRRYPNVLRDGEEVVITEKIHGANGRWLYRDGRLWVGSHKRIKREDSTNLWWRAAQKYDLAKRLEPYSGIAIYGEVFGQVQDLKYGTEQGEIRLALFDAMDTNTRRYLDADAFLRLAERLCLPVVPPLYRGPWSRSLLELAEGKSSIAGHVREGFVVRPVKERVEHMGRVILKMVGEGYLTRKGA